MFALRLTSLFLLATSFVSASPAPVTGLATRQSTADVETVFNNLKGSTDSILPQITALSNSGNATDASVTPLINQLTAALDTATASLSALPSSSISKRQSSAEVALLVAGIVRDITNALNGLLGHRRTIPGLAKLLAGVDRSLQEVLLGLGIVLAGVLKLVAVLLLDVAVLLRSLAFGLTLAALGL